MAAKTERRCDICGGEIATGPVSNDMYDDRPAYSPAFTIGDCVYHAVVQVIAVNGDPDGPQPDVHNGCLVARMAGVAHGSLPVGDVPPPARKGADGAGR